MSADNQRQSALIIDFAEYKARKEHEEFLAWARNFAMEMGIDAADFTDPDFWEEVDELMKESFEDVE